jgi:outer membrane protein, heavy metal efflux system
MANDERYSLGLCVLFAALGTVGCAATSPKPKDAQIASGASPSQIESHANDAKDQSPAPVGLVSHVNAFARPDESIAIERIGIESIATQPFAIEDESSSSNRMETYRERGMTLAELESFAMANNPTIAQLVATTQKAAGFRQQVGLRANPVIGYDATQLAAEGTGQHTAFISQEFVTGGKLELNRRVMNEALRAQLFELEAQRQRVRTDITIAFYAALAAQQRVALTTDFQAVGAKGFELAEIRKRAQEASQIEVLQAKIQMNQVDLARQQAEANYAAAWRELAAFAGNPNLAPVPLLGTFETDIQAVDWSAKRDAMLSSSPEYMAAQTRVQQARINLERQGVQAIPNVNVQMAAGVDNGTNSGLINLQVGAPIPVFNRNQGNITAARAEFSRAMLEVSRIENSIQQRLAVVSNAFDTSLAAVNKYEDEILPSARETLALAEDAYRAGEFSFIEVLTVRRTYFESNLQYLEAQVQLAQANAQVNGYVLTGGLDATVDLSGDDSLRGQTFSQE